MSGCCDVNSDIFEYLVIYDGDDKSKIIVGVTQVIADNEDAVKLIAARAIPKEYEDKLDDVRVVVRPFNG